MKLNKPMWVLLDPEKQEAAWDWESMITGTSRRNIESQRKHFIELANQMTSDCGYAGRSARQWKALKAVKVILTNAPTKYQAGTVPKVWKKAAKPSAA